MPVVQQRENQHFLNGAGGNQRSQSTLAQKFVVVADTNRDFTGTEKKLKTPVLMSAWSAKESTSAATMARSVEL